MADFYIDEFQTYLEGLCETNADVQHNVNGQRSFARFQSNEEMEQIVNSAGKNIVVVTRIHGRAYDDSDAQSMRFFITLRFACYSEFSTTDSINTALTKSFQIMWDFVSRFRLDVKADSCHALHGLEFQNINWDEILDSPFLDNHYGWDITLPFISTQPPYNPAKWS
jgi:hypothetical protein